MKIAIIDIDGVICDSSKRFEVATEGGKINYDRALSSELIHLDKLKPHAVTHLQLIRRHYSKVILLTSRYDHMRDASLAWLSEHGITATLYDRAIFKAWATERYTKTKLWKAGQAVKILQEETQGTLWQIAHSEGISLLLVEDEESNRSEIEYVVEFYHLCTRMHAFPSLLDAAYAIEHSTLA